LASAVLQLHDTPWLNKSWDMKDIHFVDNCDGVSLIDQIYVSKTFAPLSKTTCSTQLDSRDFLQNEMIFALGVALLELSYGKPIMSFKTAQDLDGQGKETVFTEYSIATRLIKRIEDRELRNYADAVIKCVRLNFETSTASLDDDDFRQRFYEGVLVPLQEDYEHATLGSRQPSSR
jgi:hypothetical protein